MSYTLRHDPESDCVILEFRGRLTLKTIREAAPQAARLCERTGCERLLNDMRAAAIQISFLELFHSPETMERAHVSRRIRRALVLPPGFHEARFLETVTRNRGHDLRVFHEIEEARQWLLGPPA